MQIIPTSINRHLERLRCNRADYVRTKLVVACTFLDRARTTDNADTRLANLNTARTLVHSAEQCLQTLALTSDELIAIRTALAAVHGQLAAQRAPQTPLLRPAARGAFPSRVNGVPSYFFVPRRAPLFAGDLFAQALRLKVLSRRLRNVGQTC